MAELQKDGASRMYLESVDPSYLVDACELLISARRKLKWTFGERTVINCPCSLCVLFYCLSAPSKRWPPSSTAHAYFLETSAPKSFFEFLQGSLEEE